MLKRAIVPMTLSALVGLYVGCTNPGTVANLDPRVPAGNALVATSTASPYVGMWTYGEAGGEGSYLALHTTPSGGVTGLFVAQGESRLRYVVPDVAGADGLTFHSLCYVKGSGTSSGTATVSIPFTVTLAPDGQTLTVTGDYGRYASSVVYTRAL